MGYRLIESPPAASGLGSPKYFQSAAKLSSTNAIATIAGPVPGFTIVLAHEAVIHPHGDREKSRIQRDHRELPTREPARQVAEAHDLIHAGNDPRQ